MVGSNEGTDVSVDSEVSDGAGLYLSRHGQPLISFASSVVLVITTRLKVVVIFGIAGLLLGTIIGIIVPPALPMIAGGLGAVGFLAGAVWETWRLRSGKTYDDIFAE